MLFPTYKYFVFPLFFILICNSLIFAGDIIPQLTIMTEEWKPYNFEEDGEINGISTDIFLLMLEKVGSEQGRSDIDILPWARAYRDVQVLSDSVLYSTARTDDREEMFKWVGPIYDIVINIITLKSNNIELDSLSEIRRFSIGTPRDDVVEDILVEKAGLTISDFLQVSSDLKNMRNLSLGIVELIPSNNDTLIDTCHQLNLDPDDFKSVIILDKTSLYYAFNIETPDYVIEAFQKAFNELKNERKVADIFSLYGK